MEVERIHLIRAELLAPFGVRFRLGWDAGGQAPIANIIQQSLVVL